MSDEVNAAKPQVQDIYKKGVKVGSVTLDLNSKVNPMNKFFKASAKAIDQLNKSGEVRENKEKNKKNKMFFYLSI